MQTIVTLKDKDYGFTFKVFRGRWQRKHAKEFIKLMKGKGIGVLKKSTIK